jgi:hypothetical protein
VLLATKSKLTGLYFHCFIEILLLQNVKVTDIIYVTSSTFAAENFRRSNLSMES